MRLFVATLALVTVAAPAWAATSKLREVESRIVSPAGSLPADLTAPEGKTRWHLESLTAGALENVSIADPGQGLTVDARSKGAAAPRSVAYAGTDARRWLLPDQDAAQMKMGARVSLRFDEIRDGLVDRIRAQVATVGIGWVHLPEGPKEVVLERVLLERQRAGEHAMRPDLLIHRWISPLEGVLAEISGPTSPDGRARLTVTSVSAITQVFSGAATLKIYADQLYRGLYTDIKYGWDRGTGTAISSLVPDPGINNVCDLVNLSTWNFSLVNSGNQTATTDAPTTSAETCNSARCGYQGYPAGGTLETPLLERLDRNLTGTIRKDNQVVQRENRATDVTFWLRAGTQNEGGAGALGTGESRFCFTDESGKPRNEVPLWQMPHNDAGGWYTQTGDTWSSDPVVSPTCQETFYTLICGSPQPFTPNPLWGRACSSSGQTFGGKQSGKVVKGGVTVLPSGHTLNTLLVRNTTEFCVYSDSSCSLLSDRVRTIVYYWQAPYVGSVALIRGPKRVDFASGETGETPCTNFTTLDFTDVEYGLLPPVSITAGAVTDTTVSLSWNPGNDTHRINGYRIYWDTDSGSSGPYAFNSVTNSGQVSISGTTATISGLTPGTTYYVTVTSLSDFTDPSSGIVSHYESIKYPTTVSGDPSFSYPVEVQAATTGGGCTPTLAVTGVTVDKALPNIHVCWNATADACAVGYDVLASDTAAPGGLGVAGQVGLTTCWDGNPDPPNTSKYILVRARGITGQGP